MKPGVFRIAALLCLGVASLAFAQTSAPPFAVLTGSLNVARASQTSTLLNDGRVLIAGGFITSSVLDGFEIYDPASGTFSTTGTMTNARAYHTATLLPNGMVLVVGGYDNGNALGSAELFDPSTNTFTATGSLSTARYEHTATLLNDGMVLIAGGFDANSATLASAELYDPSSGTFSPAGSMLGARYLPTSTLLQDGRVLITGGYNGGSLATAEIYDPTTNSFSVTGGMNRARLGHTATLMTSGKVLIAGGLGSGYLPDAEVYNPATGKFTSTGSMGTARANHAAVALNDGRVLVIGGNNTSGPLAGTEAYDPLTGTFTATGTMSTSRGYMPATLLADGRVLVTGGYIDTAFTTTTASAELFTPFTPVTGSMSDSRESARATQLNDGTVLVTGGYGSNGYLNTAELFNPASQTFALTNGPMTTNRYQHAQVLLNDGRVLVLGGVDGSGYVNTAETYDPTTGLFTATAGTMTTPRAYFTATVLKDGRVLVAGGYGGSAAVGNADIFDPATGTFSPTGFLMAPRYGHTATLLPDGRVLVTGGYSDSPLSSTEIYDPSSGSFTPAASMLIARYYHTATLLNNGKVLVEGIDATGEIYDPASDAFAPVSNNMSIDRVSASATLLQDGTVLIAGGDYDDSGSTTLTDIYDPVTNTFRPSGAMSNGRAGQVATLLHDGRVLIAGGDGNTDAELYTPYSLIPPSLVSIALSPLNGNLAVGYGRPTTAIGTFADSHTESLQSLTWSSSNTSVMTVSDDDSNRGHVYGVTSGTANVTACAGSVCGTTSVTGGAAVSDLGVTMASSAQSISAGQNITYSIQVMNHGPDSAGANNVVVTDALPSGTTLVSATSSVGSCSGGTCNLGLMAPSAMATITVVVTANTSPATLVNAVTARSDDFDPNPYNDTVSATTYVSDCLGAAPNGYNATWVGGASADWNNAVNWNTGVVPGSADNVFVCSTALHQPALLSGGASVNNLLVPAGASIDLVNSGFFAYGSVNATGPVIDTGAKGTFYMVGTGTPTLQGTVSNLDISATVMLAGNTAINGSLVLGGGAPGIWSLNGFSAVVNGYFEEYGTGSSLIMQNASDHLLVNGDFVVESATNTSLTAGLLEIAGSMNIECCDLNAFTATGTHLTRLIGAGNANRSFDISEGNFGQNQFQNLEFAVSSSSLSVDGNIYVAGDLSDTGPGVISPNQDGEFYVQGALTTAPGTSINADYVDVQGPVSIGGYFGPYEIDFDGSGQTLIGNIDADEINIYGDLTLLSDANLGASDYFEVEGSFTLNGHTANVAGDEFDTYSYTADDQTQHFYPGLLYMQQPTDKLILDVDYAYFEGNSFDSNENSTLTAGVMDVYGNLYAYDTGNGFAPTGTHLTRLVGTGGTSYGYQYLEVYNDGETYLNAFQNLEIVNTSTAGIEIDYAAIINGTLTKKAGAVSNVYGYDGYPLNAAVVDIDGLVSGTTFYDGYDGMPLIAGDAVNLNNVTFQSFSGSDIPLTFNNPGRATPYTFTGLQFLTNPCTDCGGYYIEANDTSDDSNTLVVNMVDSVPADGSDATSTSGGAVVNWSQSGSTRADLSVGLSASPMAVQLGETVSYAVTVTNSGPAAATNVVVTDTIPAGSSIYSLSSSTGSCDSSAQPVITCSLGNMINGDVESVYVTVIEPSVAGTVVNTASVSSSVTDPNSSNNSASISTPVAATVNDISLTMSAPPSVLPGATFTYDAVVNNPGQYEVDATGVVLTQALPAGFTFVSAVNATCSGSGTLVCNVGTITQGNSVDIQITLKAPSTNIVGTINGTVTANEPDPYTTDNQAKVQIVVSRLGYGVVERESLNSADSEVGEATAELPSISYSGRFVSFDSDSAFVSNDTDDDYDVFLRDNCRGVVSGCTPSTIRVSVSNDPNNPDPDDESYSSAVSGNGRYVAFFSYADNLTADDVEDEDENIFVRDTCAGTAPGTCTPKTVLASAASDGTPGNDYSADSAPAIDFSGRYVAFASNASNLVPQYNNDEEQVYLRDTCLGAPAGCHPSTILVSANLSGGAPDNNSYNPSISANGRYVAFEAYSDGSQLVIGDANDDDDNEYHHVFLRDTCIGATGSCTPKTIQLDVTPSGDQPYASSSYPSVSATGRFVAFQSDSSYIVPGITNESTNIFLRDTCTGAPAGCTPKTYLVSVNSDGEIAQGSSYLALACSDCGESDYPPSQVVSADGSKVTFFSSASNLVKGLPPSENLQAYVRNTCAGVTVACTPTTEIVSVNPAGQSANGSIVEYGYVIISGDGTTATFSSLATNLLLPTEVGDYATVYLAATAFPPPVLVDHFAVSPSTSTPLQGSPFNVTVTAQDASNNTITGYFGTVHFSLTNPDASATLPADYSFVAGDNGSHVFTGGVTLNAVGAQVLNVNDTVAPTAVGSANINVQPIPMADVAISLAALNGGATSIVATITNNGPDTAGNVVLTNTLNRFALVSATSSQGSACTFASPVVTCALGSMTSGSSATVTVQVTAPDQGWASQEFATTSSTFDQNPKNNLVSIGPSGEGLNTTIGSNIAVAISDSEGDAATLTFAGVTHPGHTTISSAAATMAPPPGYRFGTPPTVYDIATNAGFAGSIVTSLRFNPSSFHHPGKVRIFHLESGVWMDRTFGVNPGAAIVSAVTASLSPFIVVEPLNNLPVANAGPAQTVAGTNATGTAVKLNGSTSSDADGDSLTYKWTGPFPEGSGTATGVNPTVTLPPGTSSVALVVNDGEADSAPAPLTVTVSDFALSVGNSSASVKRGESATFLITVAPVYGSFDAQVSLACPGLPAGMTCSFAPVAVTPGATGGSTQLTISSSPSAAVRGHGVVFAVWLGLMPLGFVLIVNRRRRLQLFAGLALLVVLTITLMSCGGTSQTPVTNSNTNPTASTISITVNGSSGSLQHARTLTVTMTN